MDAYIAIYQTCVLIFISMYVDDWAKHRGGRAHFIAGLIGLATGIAFIGSWLQVFQ